MGSDEVIAWIKNVAPKGRPTPSREAVAPIVELAAKVDPFATPEFRRLRDSIETVLAKAVELQQALQNQALCSDEVPGFAKVNINYGLFPEWAELQATVNTFVAANSAARTGRGRPQLPAFSDWRAEAPEWAAIVRGVLVVAGWSATERHLKTVTYVIHKLIRLVLLDDVEPSTVAKFLRGSLSDRRTSRQRL